MRYPVVFAHRFFIVQLDLIQFVQQRTALPVEPADLVGDGTDLFVQPLQFALSGWEQG